METTTIVLLVLVPLLVWRIYSRLKSMMTRQPSKLWRHWASALLFPLLAVLVASGVSGNMLALASLGAGLLGGAWAGYFSLKMTRFENTAKGFFFTPNRRIGILVTMLIIARVLYRGLELYINSRALVPVPLPMQDFTHSPLTMASFGLLAGYYACYAWGMLRWRRGQKPVSALPQAAEAGPN